MPDPTTRSQILMARAERLIPGGVNSPVRAFRNVGGLPLFIASGQGAHLTDVDGCRYLDYVLSWGPLILGHAHPRVVEAISAAARLGTSFGAPTEMEIELAELLQARFPSMEMIRLVNSGTEAAMSAVRLARGHTGRARIIKFEGCYHGHGDSFLVKAGSGVATHSVPGFPGITLGTAQDTLVAPFNDAQAVEELLTNHPGEVAAVIIEPVPGNMGVVLPAPGFLEKVRQLCTFHGCLLIFDEVMSGFRVAPGGAQEKYGITPDLTLLGKVAGGGLPLAAFGGRREIMARLAPLGPVYQAGTLSGNPLAVAAGIATLHVLQEEDGFGQLEALGRMLEQGIRQLLHKTNGACQFYRAGSMFSLFFNSAPVVDWETSAKSDKDLFQKFFWGMLEQGVYLAPSPYEAGFLSTAHTAVDIEQTLDAMARVLGTLSQN